MTTTFTVEGKQILRVRDEYRDIVDTKDGTPPSIKQLTVATDRPGQNKSEYWSMWPSRYDYLYILFTEIDAPKPTREFPRLCRGGSKSLTYPAVDTPSVHRRDSNREPPRTR